MPRKSPLLLLVPISVFLIVAPLVRADSIKNLTQFDSEQPFTLYGSDYTGTFALTPNSIVHLTNGFLHFAFSTPVGWAGGDATYAFNFGGQFISGEFTNVSPCSPPSNPCFGFGLGGSLNVSLKTPATWTLTFLGAHGATETANFFVSNATPEPETMVLFGTGGVLLAVIYRYRIRSPGKSSRTCFAVRRLRT